MLPRTRPPPAGAAWRGPPPRKSSDPMSRSAPRSVSASGARSPTRTPGCTPARGRLPEPFHGPVEQPLSGVSRRLPAWPHARGRAALATTSFLSRHSVGLAGNRLRYCSRLQLLLLTAGRLFGRPARRTARTDPHPSPATTMSRGAAGGSLDPQHSSNHSAPSSCRPTVLKFFTRGSRAPRYSRCSPQAGTARRAALRRLCWKGSHVRFICIPGASPALPSGRAVTLTPT